MPKYIINCIIAFCSFIFFGCLVITTESFVGLTANSAIRLFFPVILSAILSGIILLPIILPTITKIVRWLTSKYLNFLVLPANKLSGLVSKEVREVFMDFKIGTIIVMILFLFYGDMEEIIGLFPNEKISFISLGIIFYFGIQSGRSLYKAFSSTNPEYPIIAGKIPKKYTLTGDDYVRSVRNWFHYSDKIALLKAKRIRSI